MIAEDNSNINPLCNDVRCRTFVDLLRMYGLNLLVHCPTIVTETSATCIIDSFITSLDYGRRVVTPLISDHDAISVLVLVLCSLQK